VYLQVQISSYIKFKYHISSPYDHSFFLHTNVLLSSSQVEWKLSIDKKRKNASKVPCVCALNSLVNAHPEKGRLDSHALHHTLLSAPLFCKVHPWSKRHSAVPVISPIAASPIQGAGAGSTTGAEPYQSSNRRQPRLHLHRDRPLYLTTSSLALNI
jgi:hypothetical protein